MIFRQLFDSATSTFTYLIGDEDSGEAILIDAVYEQHLRDVALLRELHLTLRYTVETHIHADHATGSWLLRKVTGCKITVPAITKAEEADVMLNHGDTITVGKVSLKVRATPGHTDGCTTYVLDEECMAFTGDALLIRGAGRTDFQQGNASTLFRSVREQILSLPSNYRLYPAHDYGGRTMTTVAEEREHNPRLGDHVREQDFVGFMNNLGLPHPKRMDAAVPANMVCGRPSDPSAAPHMPSWAPLVRTFAGVWQLAPEWLHLHGEEVHILDVREPEEVKVSYMGRVAGSEMLPLSQLSERMAEVPRDKPVVCVCPAGARSSHAAKLIEKAGIERVANLAGGLLQWRLLGLPFV